MGKLPYFKFYPSDFMGSANVSMMLPAECGIYIKLLCVMWQRGPLPDDPRRLGRLANASDDEMRDAWPAVRECFELDDDGLLYHPRLEKERSDAESRRASAQKAAHAMHSKRNADAYADAPADAYAPKDASDHAEGGASGVRYSESQKPRGSEAIESSASAKADEGGPSFGDVMAVVRTELHLGQDTPETRRSGSVLKRDYAGKVPAQDVIDACRGTRKLIDAGMVAEIEPGEPVGLRFLRSWKLDSRFLFDAAIDHERFHANDTRMKGGLRRVSA